MVRRRRRATLAYSATDLRDRETVKPQPIYLCTSSRSSSIFGLSLGNLVKLVSASFDLKGSKSGKSPGAKLCCFITARNTAPRSASIDSQAIGLQHAPSYDTRMTHGDHVQAAFVSTSWARFTLDMLLTLSPYSANDGTRTPPCIYRQYSTYGVRNHRLLFHSRSCRSSRSCTN